ncbi:MAG TPA: CARDB domain-containing protein [Balneolales bacterium]|nr:CARDB domain-containing protein [Balneolales bacterium]
MGLFNPAYHSTFALIVLVALFPAAAFLAWWSYRMPVALNNSMRYLLVGLRTLALWLILAVLLNPVFRMTHTWEEKPDIAVLLDNSASVTINKGDYQGSRDYKNVVKSLQLSDTSHVHYQIFSFAKDVKKTNPDSLKLNGQDTDLDNALKSLTQQNQNYKAIVLVTDGISTYGPDPTYTVNQLNTPVFTVAVGDTSYERDIVVENVVHPDKAYKDSPTPISVTVLNDGFSGHKIEVQLLRDGHIVDHKTIQSNSQRSSMTVNFSVKPTHTGLQQYEVNVPALKEEANTRNNHRYMTLNVLDNQTRILDIAFEIYPDVKTVRTILGEDKGIKLESRTWISGDAFIGGKLPVKTDSLDLIILQGYPNPSIPVSTRNEIRRLIQNKPVVLLATPEMDISQADQSLRAVLPLIGPAKFIPMDISLEENPAEKGHPVLDLPHIDDQSSSPFWYGPITHVTASQGSHVLLKATYHGQNTNSPILALRTVGNRRLAELLAFGYYHWYQLPGKTRDYVTKLISNIAKWTATQPDDRLLRLQPSQTVYDESEPVVFNATLNNQNGQPEDGAVIELTVGGNQYNDHHFTMEHTGTGQYSIQIGTLPDGRYHYTATARKQQITAGKASGEFVVGSKGTEFVNTQRNDDLLRYISKTTGGMFYSWKQAGSVITGIRNKGLMNVTKKTEEASYPLHQSPWWFIAVLVLLTSEWVLRKVKAL